MYITVLFTHEVN